MELNKDKILDLYNTKIKEITSQIKYDEKIKYSHVILFKDYISRLFLWRDVLEINNTHLKTRESHNILIYLNNEFKEIFDLEIINEKSNFNAYFIRLYVCWNIFKSYINFSKYKNLPEPYNPILKIILRGGDIYIHNGVYHIDDFGVSINNILNGKEKYFSPSLEDDFLDFLDLKFKKGELTNFTNYNDIWITYKNKGSLM
ncbi:hypothetical protein ACSTS3_21110 [Aquimarina muelleri]|uniref:hypothetical protein n=1 Tax=Aquimarina muelleri TaxID=279356 RepID=UPI003F686011